MPDNGQMIVTIDDGAYLGPACGTADIVVTPIRMRLERLSLRRSDIHGRRLDENRCGRGGQSENPSIETAFPTIRRPWNLSRL